MADQQNRVNPKSYRQLDPTGQRCDMRGAVVWHATCTRADPAHWPLKHRVTRPTHRDDGYSVPSEMIWRKPDAVDDNAPDAVRRGLGTTARPRPTTVCPLMTAPLRKTGRETAGEDGLRGAIQFTKNGGSPRQRNF